MRRSHNHDLMLILNCGLSLIVIFYQADKLFGIVGMRKWFGIGGFVIPLIIVVILSRFIWSDRFVSARFRKAMPIMGLLVLYLFVCGIGGFMGYIIGIMVIKEHLGESALIPLILSIGIWVLRPQWGVGLFLILIPVVLISAIWVGLGYRVHSDIVSEMSFEGRYYFLEVEDTASDGDFFELYECNAYGVGCKSIYHSRISMQVTNDYDHSATIYQESVLAVRNNLLVVISGKSTLYILYP